MSIRETGLNNITWAMIDNLGRSLSTIDAITSFAKITKDENGNIGPVKVNWMEGIEVKEFKTTLHISVRIFINGDVKIKFLTRTMHSLVVNYISRNCPIYTPGNIQTKVFIEGVSNVATF